METKNTLHFTQSKLKAIAASPLDETRYKDLTQRSLWLYVSPKAEKSFVFSRKVKGQTRRKVIGQLGVMNVTEAQGKVAEMLGRLAKGDSWEDIAGNQQKENPTFNAFFERYMNDHAKPHKKSWKSDISNYNLHIKAALGHCLLEDITHGQLQALQAKISEKRPQAKGRDLGGKLVCNRCFELIRGIYNKAIEWGSYQYPFPPTRHIKPFPEKNIERYLLEDELKRFWPALNSPETPEHLQLFCNIALFTGVRKGNIFAMRWEEVDFKNEWWRIPETKNGEAHTATLPPQLLALLKPLKAQSQSPFVFPSANSSSGHITDMKKAFQSLMARAKIADFRIHDLRHTFASYQAMNNASLHIVGAALGHKNSVTTQRYAHLQKDPVRKAANQAVDSMCSVRQHS